MSLESFVTYASTHTKNNDKNVAVDLFRELVDYYIEVFRYRRGIEISQEVTEIYTNIELGENSNPITDLDLVAINGNDVYIFMVKSRKHSRTQARKRNTSQLRRALPYIEEHFSIEPYAFTVSYINGRFDIRHYRTNEELTLRTPVFDFNI